MHTQVFDADDLVNDAIWSRARRMYQQHGYSLGYRADWRQIGLTGRFKFFELSARALGVSL